MSISTRRTILDTFKDDLYKIRESREYLTTIAEVKRGIPPEDPPMNRPCIYFSNIRSEKTEELQGGRRQRALHLNLWCFINVQTQDYDELDRLVRDVEFFCESTDNTYADTTFVKDMAVYEGNLLMDPIGIALIEVIIYYSYDDTNP